MPRSPRTVPLAYFLTFTCYGTWLHGREPGSVDKAHNQFGNPLLPADSQREAKNQLILGEPPFQLDAARRRVVLATLREVAAFRGWHLLAAHVRCLHVHLVVQGEGDPDKMLNDFKAYATRRLKEAGFDPGRRRRWTQGGSTRYLWKAENVKEAIRYVAEQQGEPMEVYVAPAELIGE
jgi:hypothetical protein